MSSLMTWSVGLTLAQLLVWASYMPFTYLGRGNTITGMLDLTSNTVTQANITNTKHDMFCPGTR